MKSKEINEHLLKIITEAGIVVRKDTLNRTKGGFCLLDDNKIIVLNKLLPIETHNKLLAKCIVELDINNMNLFIPPVIREFIDNEAVVGAKQENVEFSI